MSLFFPVPLYVYVPLENDFNTNCKSTLGGQFITNLEPLAAPTGSTARTVAQMVSSRPNSQPEDRNSNAPLQCQSEAHSTV